MIFLADVNVHMTLFFYLNYSYYDHQLAYDFVVVVAIAFLVLSPVVGVVQLKHQFFAASRELCAFLFWLIVTASSAFF